MDDVLKLMVGEKVWITLMHSLSRIMVFEVLAASGVMNTKFGSDL